MSTVMITMTRKIFPMIIMNDQMTIKASVEEPWAVCHHQRHSGSLQTTSAHSITISTSTPSSSFSSSSAASTSSIQRSYSWATSYSISSSSIWEWETVSPSVYLVGQLRKFTTRETRDGLRLTINFRLLIDHQLITCLLQRITTWPSVFYNHTQLRHWVVDFCSIGGWHLALPHFGKSHCKTTIHIHICIGRYYTVHFVCLLAFSIIQTLICWSQHVVDIAMALTLLQHLDSKWRTFKESCQL